MVLRFFILSLKFYKFFIVSVTVAWWFGWIWFWSGPEFFFKVLILGAYSPGLCEVTFFIIVQ